RRGGSDDPTPRTESVGGSDTDPAKEFERKLSMINRINGARDPGPKPSHTPNEVEHPSQTFRAEKDEWVNAVDNHERFDARQAMRRAHAAEGGTIVNHDPDSAGRELENL